MDKVGDMISVIVPVYNSECYLKECIMSVLQQVYQDIEVILIDDGSTDTSKEICREFQEKDSRIRFCRQEHQGVSAARNKALDLARGSYIFFLDSDDVIDPGILEKFLTQIRLQKAAMVFCRYSQAGFTESRRMEEGQENKKEEWILLDRVRMTEQFSRNHRIFGGIGGKLVTKEVIGDLRFENNLTVGEDTLFLYRLIRKGISAVYTTNAMYYYRGYGSSSVLRYTMKGISDACRVVKKIESGEHECGRTENARSWEGEYLSNLKRAVEYLDKKELHRMRLDVAKELKNPYFRQRKIRVRIAVFLQFFCYPLYQSVKMAYRFVAGDREQKKDVPEQKSCCCGCGVCEAACPYKAVAMVIDSEGFYYPKVDWEKCTGCGVCGIFCPMKNRKKSGGERTYLGAQAKENKIRFSSSSGGLFPVLAEEVLSSGGVVFGAVMAENGRVYHRGIETEKELPFLQKTKYVQSDMSGCYQKIRKYLDERKTVLFTGTPCQCQAVRSYIGEKEENLLLADLVCYGVPSPGIWNRYVKELEQQYQGAFRGFSFRDKRKEDNGHTVAVRIGAEEYTYPIQEDPYCQMYFRNYTIRPSCYSCGFCTVKRESDITMGDFWGIEKIKPEMDDGMGTSLVILHSRKGQELWNKVSRHFRYFQCQKEEILQPRLQKPVSQPKRRQWFMCCVRVMPLGKTEKIFRNHRQIT